jgi:hypothetical protein
MENTESVTATESATATDGTEPKVRKPRAPKAEITVGLLKAMKKLAPAHFADTCELNKDNPVFQRALRQLAAEDAEAAEITGLGRGEMVCDFRRGVFVSLASLGAVKGTKVSVTQVSDTEVSVKVL